MFQNMRLEAVESPLDIRWDIHLVSEAALPRGLGLIRQSCTDAVSSRFFKPSRLDWYLRFVFGNTDLH
jgi:hypothetical protein